MRDSETKKNRIHGISMMKKWNLFSACLAVIVVMVLALPARANWNLVTADFKEQTGLTVNTWESGAGLSFTDNSGKLNTIPTRDVLSLTSTAAPPAAPAAGPPDWRLTLRNGDVLYGAPDGVSGQSLKFTTPELGSIAVPLKLVAEIDSLRKKAEPASGAATQAAVPVKGLPDQDLVCLANRDTLQGLLVDFAAGKLQIAVTANANAIANVDAKVVDRVFLAGTSAPRTLPPLAARLTFASGTILTVPLDKPKSFSWTIDNVLFKDPAGQERKASAGGILHVDVVGGRVVCLTELDPEKDEQTTLMGTRWPTQIDKNVMGDPLRVEKKIYTRGLGVHVRSHLVYHLDGSFETLKVRVGLDDSAAPLGAADVSVLLDGKVLWQAKGLQTGDAAKGAIGQASAELALPIKGGKRLELRADPTTAMGRDGKVDVLGRVDWLDVALVRP